MRRIETPRPAAIQQERIQRIVGSNNFILNRGRRSDRVVTSFTSVRFGALASLAMINRVLACGGDYRGWHIERAVRAFWGWSWLVGAVRVAALTGSATRIRHLSYMFRFPAHLLFWRNPSNSG